MMKLKKKSIKQQKKNPSQPSLTPQTLDLDHETQIIS
jgi:hypothetical protein